MYSEYCQYINDNIDNIKNLSFKSNKDYNHILEHVSKLHGSLYLELILKEFKEIKIENIIEFVNINDKFGNPNIYNFNIMGYSLECSPTSLRYVYHALLILKHYDKKKCNNIVEVGCGYGGLCLAINYFMNNFDINIENYHIIDLNLPIILIKNYLSLFTDIIKTKIFYHDSSTYGENIIDINLFFISNYCFTEISNIHNQKYIDILLSKVQNGFIVWQNGGNNGAYPVKISDNIINKKIENIIEEKPQTDAGYDIYKNYFVYF